MFLRQSTADVVAFGPITDDDGLTYYTSSLSTTELGLMKDSATSIADSTNSSTYIGDGMHSISLTASEVDTLGRFWITVSKSGLAPHREKFQVITSQFYDSMSGADTLQCDVREINGSATAASRQSYAARAIFTGTVTNAETPDTLDFTTDLALPTSRINGRVVLFIETDSNIPYDGGKIDTYSNTNGKIVLTAALASAPSVGDRFVIV